jgi:predicted RNA-binding protein with PUA-like domain
VVPNVVATPLVTRDNLGAWLVRCNPATWDLPQFIEDGHDRIGVWSVARNYRSRLMEPGDRLVLWVAGSSNLMVRGIWGLGHVTRDAYDAVADDADDYGYWLDQDHADRVDNVVDVDLPILVTPVSDAELREAGIDALEVQLQPQGSNPSWISKEQLAQLLPLLPDWKAVPESEDEVTISTTHGAGFGNPAQNYLVEQAGMEAAKEAYEADGWTIADVSREKLGWDLTAKKAGQQLKIEVKGVSGDKPKVLLTANELRAAKTKADWTLVVVTRALSDPTVIQVDAETVIEAALPYVLQSRPE